MSEDRSVDGKDGGEGAEAKLPPGALVELVSLPR